MNRSFVLSLGVVSCAAASSCLGAVLQGPGGTCQAGVNNAGNLADTTAVVGLRRVSGAIDVVSPGDFYDTWGASLGSLVGQAISNGTNVNLAANGAPVFGTSTASTSTFVTSAGVNVLRVNHSFSFAAANVVRVDTTVTNVSNAAGAARYRRSVDLDVVTTSSSNPITEYQNDQTRADPYAFPIINALWNTGGGAFHSSSPLAAITTGLIPVTGGLSTIEEQSVAITLDLGILQPNQAASFGFLYAISDVGQSPAQLRTQLLGLGASFTAVVTDTGSLTHSGAIAFIPAPGSIGVLGVAGATSMIRRRRR
jgi:hypothetical protein